MTTTLNASTAGAGGFIATSDNSGVLALQTAGTTAITVDASQNVGIKNISPSAPLDVTGTIKSSTYSQYGSSMYYGIGNSLSGSYATTDLAVYNAANGNTVFLTNNAERMRIDSSGNLLVGTTSAPAISGVPSNSFILNSGASGNWALGIQNIASSGGARGIAINYSAQTPNNTQSEPLFFSDSTAYRFRFVSNGGLYNYSANDSNISDRREKTNFAPSKPYLNVICSIPVQTFNYIDQNIEQDDGLTLGVVAQDVQAVAPEFVTEANWGTEEKPKMRLSIYQTDLQYALMKSIQELKQINDTQAETINALTARIVALEVK